MPYTVSYADTGIQRHEFDAYVRLLGKRGIDWTNTPRIAEPQTANRWLCVWSNRDEAEAFCEEIRQETRDDKWYVRDLAESSDVSSGPLMPIIIHVTRQSLGSTFTLHPHSRTAIRRRFPDAKQVSSVYVEHGTQFDLERTHGPIWDHIASVLMGLSLEQIDQLGGYRVFSPATEQNIYDSSAITA